MHSKAEISSDFKPIQKQNKFRKEIMSCYLNLLLFFLFVLENKIMKGTSVAGWLLQYRRWGFFSWSKVSLGCWFLYALESAYLAAVQGFSTRYVFSLPIWRSFHMMLTSDLNSIAFQEVEFAVILVDTLITLYFLQLSYDKDDSFSLFCAFIGYWVNMEVFFENFLCLYILCGEPPQSACNFIILV